MIRILLDKRDAIAWLRQCAIIVIECKCVSVPRTRRRRDRSCPESLCTTRTSFLTWNVWSSFGKRSPGPLCSPGLVWEGLSRRSLEHQGQWLASNSHGRVFDRGSVYAMDAAHCPGNEHNPTHCNRMRRARVGGVRRGAETEAKTEKVGTITAAMNELKPRSKTKLKWKSAMRKSRICTSCHKIYRHTEPQASCAPMPSVLSIRHYKMAGPQEESSFPSRRYGAMALSQFSGKKSGVQLLWWLTRRFLGWMPTDHGRQFSVVWVFCRKTSCRMI